MSGKVVLERFYLWVRRFIDDETIGVSNVRNRDVWVRAALANIPAQSRLLDAGCGERPYRDSCTHLKYVSQDFGKYDGRGDDVGLQFKNWNQSEIDIISDIVAIPQSDSSFDAVLCTEVFEHIPNPVLAIREFSRLLRPGGLLIITAPFCSINHFSPYFFQTGFSRYYYEHHLTDNGFDILEISPNGSYFEYIAQEVRRIPAVSGMYGGQRLSAIDRLALAAMLKLLGRLEKTTRASSELLNYGLHVRAQRRHA